MQDNPSLKYNDAGQHPAIPETVIINKELGGCQPGTSSATASRRQPPDRLRRVFSDPVANKAFNEKISADGQGAKEQRGVNSGNAWHDTLPPFGPSRRPFTSFPFSLSRTSLNLVQRRDDRTLRCAFLRTFHPSATLKTIQTGPCNAVHTHVHNNKSSCKNTWPERTNPMT